MWKRLRDDVFLTLKFFNTIFRVFLRPKFINTLFRVFLTLKCLLKHNIFGIFSHNIFGIFRYLNF